MKYSIKIISSMLDPLYKIIRRLVYKLLKLMDYLVCEKKKLQIKFKITLFHILVKLLVSEVTILGLLNQNCGIIMLSCLKSY